MELPFIYLFLFFSVFLLAISYMLKQPAFVTITGIILIIVGISIFSGIKIPIYESAECEYTQLNSTTTGDSTLYSYELQCPTLQYETINSTQTKAASIILSLSALVLIFIGSLGMLKPDSGSDDDE